MANNRTNNSHRQTKRSSRRVNVKTLAYRLGVSEYALRHWLRIRYGLRRKPWLWMRDERRRSSLRTGRTGDEVPRQKARSTFQSGSRMHDRSPRNGASGE